MTKIEKNKLILRTNVANCKGTTEIWTTTIYKSPAAAAVALKTFFHGTMVRFAKNSSANFYITRDKP